MAYNHYTASLALQLDDDRPHSLDDVQVALARRTRVTVVQLVGEALGVLDGMTCLTQ